MAYIISWNNSHFFNNFRVNTLIFSHGMSTGNVESFSKVSLSTFHYMSRRKFRDFFTFIGIIIQADGFFASRYDASIMMSKLVEEDMTRCLSTTIMLQEVMTFMPLFMLASLRPRSLSVRTKTYRYVVAFLRWYSILQQFTEWGIMASFDTCRSEDADIWRFLW